MYTTHGAPTGTACADAHEQNTAVGVLLKSSQLSLSVFRTHIPIEPSNRHLQIVDKRALQQIKPTFEEAEDDCLSFACTRDKVMS